MQDSLTDTINDALLLTKEQDDKAFITSLGRGLLLLSAFENEQTLTHQQLCEITGLPKATVSRLLHTLLTLKFITRGTNDSFKLGKYLSKHCAGAWSYQDMVDDALR